MPRQRSNTITYPEGTTPLKDLPVDAGKEKEVVAEVKADAPDPSRAWVGGIVTNLVNLGLIAAIGYATDTWISGIISVVINWAVWGIHAYPQQSEKFFDATGSLTYISLIISGFFIGLREDPYQLFNIRKLVLSCMVLAWCIRLGSYLLQRILRDGKDGRFDSLKQNWCQWLGIWSFQAGWCFLVALPVLVVQSKACISSDRNSQCANLLDLHFVAPGNEFNISLMDILGWLIWFGAFAFEVIADRQKDAFRQDPANKGRYITSGLWAYSRHPNYFGEIMLWVGICISGSSCFTNWDWLSLISPINTFILLNYVSGVPMLEKTRLERWGHEPAWRWYTDKTPCVFPTIFRPPPYDPKDAAVELTDSKTLA